MALGAIVAEELYGLSMPVIVATEESWMKLQSASHVSIDEAQLRLRPVDASIEFDP